MPLIKKNCSPRAEMNRQTKPPSSRDQHSPLLLSSSRDPTDCLLPSSSPRDGPASPIDRSVSAGIRTAPEMAPATLLPDTASPTPLMTSSPGATGRRRTADGEPAEEEEEGTEETTRSSLVYSVSPSTSLPFRSTSGSSCSRRSSHHSAGQTSDTEGGRGW